MCLFSTKWCFPPWAGQVGGGRLARVRPHTQGVRHDASAEETAEREADPGER
jgi:hypothetical protein